MPLLSVTQILSRLGMKKRGIVYRAIETGELPAYRFGSASRPTFRVSEEDLQAFLDRRRQTVGMEVAHA